jgi:16S rRNA (cytosine1402-N4)-methyltransferase
MSSHHHASVMLKQSITALNLKPDGIYIDATFGRGGHARTILQNLKGEARLIAFDQDAQAIEYAQQNFSDARLELIHAPFSCMKNELEARNLLGKVDGILMDLGVSSPQLDNAQRGFSFQRDGELDMRMNQTQGLSAREWLTIADETEIANVLFQFGEERKSRLIARKIKEFQKQEALKTTLQLANIIAQVVYGKKNKHPATRSFQAIRIFINQELSQIEQVLQDSAQILNVNGRLSVISFHSLEDRIIKRFIQKNSRAKPILKGLPIAQNSIEKTPFKDLGKQFADIEEVKHNPRSRSAILRVAQKN